MKNIDFVHMQCFHFKMPFGNVPKSEACMYIREQKKINYVTVYPVAKKHV